MIRDIEMAAEVALLGLFTLRYSLEVPVMPELPIIRYPYFADGSSRHLKTQSSQPASQSHLGDSLPLMILIFYIAPIVLLLALCLTAYMKRKFAFRWQIKQLSQTATLERMLRLKLQRF
ncbi:MAG: hypothetical protein HC929_24515 [Leptolyngbyaceae cyanobacterium SM2_5_2]|nr:hypothetical protein [Leptolyngbyaceae cyanobacterium SM2_5_2]